SVLDQDYRQIEYIVIDGGSRDGSVEILQRYSSQLAYWVSERDRGQTEAIAKGLRQGHGDVLGYLNSDDLYLPGALGSVAAFFQAHPEVGLVYGDCQVIDPAGRVLGILPPHDFSLRRAIERAEFIPQPAAFWRRSVAEDVGPFDVSLQYAMDYEYFIRLARASRVAHIPQVVAAFRLHPASKTVARDELHWRDTRAVSERYGLRPWHAWYWLRRLRHWGPRALPGPAQAWLRRHMGRLQDLYQLDRS